jgi:negative regulator of flagellin synthesis FlgM
MDATTGVVPRYSIEGRTRMHVYGPAHLHGAQLVNSPHSAALNRPTSTQSSGPIQDEVHISDAARLLDQVNDLPAIRQDRVNQIRQQIANGTYETPEKMQVAVQRLLGEIG